MSDYSQIGSAIKTTFLADSWLGNPANVKTVEIWKRGFMIQDARDALYFNINDLPALAIVPNAEPKKSDQATTNEIRSYVKSQIVVVTRNRDPQGEKDVQSAIVANVERVLEKQKSSAQALGIDAYVSDVSTVDEQFKDGEYYYFVSTTSCQIDITITF